MTDLNISDSRAPEYVSARPIPADEAPMLELLRLWSVIWDNRMFIGLLTTIIFASVLNLYLLLPAKYAAVTQILIDRDLQIVDNDLTPGTPTDDSQFAVVETQRQVMTSDTVLRSVIASERLDTDPEFGGRTTFLSLDVEELLHRVLAFEPQAPDLKALRELWQTVWAKRDKGSYIVDLWVKTKDAEKSARVANAIARTFIQQELAVRSNMARHASNAILTRLDELRDHLREAEGRVEKYKATRDIINVEGELINEQGLAQLNRELSAARAETSKAKSRYEQIKRLAESNATPGAIAEAVKSETIMALRVRYAAARQAEMSLTSQLMPAHPNVQRARARVASVSSEISDELHRIAEASHNDFEHAKANETDLSRKVETLKDTALSTNEAQVKMRELNRDAEANRIVYNSFLVRARELSEQVVVDSVVARIISPAIAPIKPSGPPLMLIIVALIVVSFALSAFYVMARDAVARAAGGIMKNG